RAGTGGHRGEGCWEVMARAGGGDRLGLVVVRLPRAGRWTGSRRDPLLLPNVRGGLSARRDGRAAALELAPALRDLVDRPPAGRTVLSRTRPLYAPRAAASARRVAGAAHGVHRRHDRRVRTEPRARTGRRPGRGVALHRARTGAVRTLFAQLLRGDRLAAPGMSGDQRPRGGAARSRRLRSRPRDRHELARGLSPDDDLRRLHLGEPGARDADRGTVDGAAEGGA